MFTGLHNYHHNLISEHLQHSKKKHAISYVECLLYAWYPKKCFIDIISFSLPIT